MNGPRTKTGSKSKQKSTNRNVPLFFWVLINEVYG